MRSSDRELRHHVHRGMPHAGDAMEGGTGADGHGATDAQAFVLGAGNWDAEAMRAGQESHREFQRRLFTGDRRSDDVGPLRCMTFAENYVMVRRPGAAPFVMVSSEWLRLPLTSSLPTDQQP